MAPIIPLLEIGLIGAGIGAASGAFGKNPKPPGVPSPPDPSKAADAAASQLSDQRRLLLATGGQTDYTGGSATILGTDVTHTTLLGSA